MELKLLAGNTALKKMIIYYNDTDTTKKPTVLETMPQTIKYDFYFSFLISILFYFIGLGLVVICGVVAAPCYPKSALRGAEFPSKGCGSRRYADRSPRNRLLRTSSGPEGSSDK